MLTLLFLSVGVLSRADEAAEHHRAALKKGAIAMGVLGVLFIGAGAGLAGAGAAGRVDTRLTNQVIPAFFIPGGIFAISAIIMGVESTNQASPSPWTAY